MDKQPSKYVPVLKWRQGEYQALNRLYDSVKDGIIPLVNIPPIEYDFEEKRLKKTAHEHVQLFPRRFSAKWGNRPSFIDFDESLHDEFMDSGASVVSFVFEELSALGHNPVPVTGISRSKNYQAVIKTAHKECGTGMAVRIKLEELMHPEISKHISDLIKYHGISFDNIDLIIDLGAPQSFEPYVTFAKALVKRIKAIARLDSFRSFILVATSISISDVKAPGAVMPRHEWSLYKALVERLRDVRLPNYGDYCIELPGYTSLDMRFVNAAEDYIYNG